MWTKTYKSNTAEFPEGRDLVVALVGRLICEDLDGSWAHIERVKAKGDSVLLDGYRNFVEVLWSDGILKVNASGVDEARFVALWRKERDLFEVPVADQEQLMKCVLASLADVSPEAYHIKGWIDGL